MKIEDVYKSIEHPNYKKQAIEISVSGIDPEGVHCKVSKIKYHLSK